MVGLSVRSLPLCLEEAGRNRAGASTVLVARVCVCVKDGRVGVLSSPSFFAQGEDMDFDVVLLGVLTQKKLHATSKSRNGGSCYT